MAHKDAFPLLGAIHTLASSTTDCNSKALGRAGCHGKSCVGAAVAIETRIRYKPLQSHSVELTQVCEPAFSLKRLNCVLGNIKHFIYLFLLFIKVSFGFYIFTKTIQHSATYSWLITMSELAKLDFEIYLAQITFIRI